MEVEEGTVGRLSTVPCRGGYSGANRASSEAASFLACHTCQKVEPVPSALMARKMLPPTGCVEDVRWVWAYVQTVSA